MNKIPFANVTVFLLFFGVALIEAPMKGNWIEGALFVGLGVLSLWADFKKK